MSNPPDAEISHGSTPIPQLPRPPSPSTDQGILPRREASDTQRDALPPTSDVKIEDLSSVAALKLLCNMMETLAHITGDIPPTPPVERPGQRGLNHSLQENGIASRGPQDESNRSQDQARPSSSRYEDHDDVPPRAKTPIGSPEARPSEPLHVPDPKVEPLDVQHGIIVRKFYSKKAPEIPLEEYLLRVHQYCPMTTGVYLATALYVHRLAVVERIIPVTARNAHRLVLAGLRVTSKKLEDHKYSHSRFAKVGGVSETELAKLEISFCFLTNFDLKATYEMLSAHALIISDSTMFRRKVQPFKPVLPLGRSKRNVNPGLGNVMPAVPSEAPAAA